MKNRYKNSVFGVIWSLLMPLATVAVLTFAMTKLLHNPEPNFAAYLFACILPYTFFQSSILDAAQSILNHSALISKVYFPREILPLAIILSNFVHLLLGYAVFFFYLLLVWTVDPRQIPFQATSPLIIFILIPHLLFTVGIGLLLCAWNTFYEDIKYVTTILMSLFFYLSPVLYGVERMRYADGTSNAVQLLLYKITYLNPMTSFLIGYRKLLLAPTPPINGDLSKPWIPLEWKYIALSSVIAVAVCIIGYHKFNKDKWRFVER